MNVSLPSISRPLGIRTILFLVVAVMVVGLVGILGVVDEILVRHNAGKILSREGRLVAQSFAFGLDMRHEADRFMAAQKVVDPDDEQEENPKVAQVQELVTIRREMSAVLAIRHNVTRVDLLSRQAGLPHIVSTSGAPMTQAERNAHETIALGLKPWTSVRESAGGDAIYVVVPFIHANRTMGTVGVRLSFYEMNALIRKEKERMAFILLAGFILLMGGLSFVLKKWLIDPIRRLEKDMREVGEGNLAGAYVIEGSSEMQSTGESFSRMVEMLRTRTREKETLLEEVRELNAGLQDRILEKTQELRAKNRTLAETNEAMYFLQRRLSELERRAAVGEGMAVVAHELGNPLHSIAGHLELLFEESGLSSRVEEALRIVSGQTDRMIKTIRKLLTISRRSDPPQERIEIEPMLRGIASLVEPRLRSAGVTLTLEIKQEDHPLWVMGENDALQSLFINLLENALDAIEGPGKILICAEETPEGLLLSVKDSGPGIDPAVRLRVFDPFFTTKPSGTGLGLAVCRKIVEDLGGSIRLGDGPGGEMIVLFPLQSSEPPLSQSFGSGQEAATRT